METYYFTIDFSTIKNGREVYPLIKEALHFPDYFGKNLDALWDCLTDMSGDYNQIEIRGVKTLSKSLQDYLEEIFMVIKEAEKRYPEYYHITFVD